MHTFLEFLYEYVLQVFTLTEKILFWLDIGLTQIAIAYFLQEKRDCNLFAIVDCNEHLKKFFHQSRFDKI